MLGLAHNDDDQLVYIVYQGLQLGLRKRHVGEAIPIRREALPEDLAGIAEFLASAAAEGIVAKTFTFDGGNWMS